MTSVRSKLTVIRRATACVLCVLLLVLIFISHRYTTKKLEDYVQRNWTLSAKPFGASQYNCGQEEAFAFIPKATVCKWAQTEFLIVFGTLSVDRDGQQRRRVLQRTTCWTFPGVATRGNGYNGSMLVLYTLARHPAHGFVYSESLRLEAALWHDVLTFPINEGRISTNKKFAGDGHYGNEAAVAMGKKVYFWLDLSLRAFPRAVFVGKADEDIFMNVPQYLADLRLLPRRGTYWGPYSVAEVLINKQMERKRFTYMVGYAVAFGRDVVETIVNYEPLRRLITLPYTKETELDFVVMTMNFDDVMLGRILKETGYPAIFVADKYGCRFHNNGEEQERGFRNFSEHSVIAHHIGEYAYQNFMHYFIKNGIVIYDTKIEKVSSTVYEVKCPLKR